MSGRGGAADRRKGFQRGLDADDARRKRETNIVELRKAKRDESLQKKRAVFGGGVPPPGLGLAPTAEDSTRATSKVNWRERGGLCVRARRPVPRPAARGLEAHDQRGCASSVGGWVGCVGGVCPSVARKQRRAAKHGSPMPTLPFPPSSPTQQQLEQLPAMVQGVWSEDPAAQLEATTQFRKLLSIGEKEGNGGVKKRATKVPRSPSPPPTTPTQQNATPPSRKSSPRASSPASSSSCSAGTPPPSSSRRRGL